MILYIYNEILVNLLFSAKTSPYNATRMHGVKQQGNA